MNVETVTGLRGKLFENHSLSDYTSWKVGGPARWLYLPHDIEDVQQLLSQLPTELPVLWLGLGSNVLIRDGGFHGVVIITQGTLSRLTQEGPTLIRAEAGVACGTLARYSARLNLAGLEFMAGIPGTVGGALSMNAGCYGSETWTFVQKVEILSRHGERFFYKPEDYHIQYRHVTPRHPIGEHWFIAGYFALQPGNKTESLQTIRELLEKRNASQPTHFPNCGSVFRNPKGAYAAQLIERCHLKGFTCGGASVSEKHANFIINHGHASAHDIETLIQHIQKTVYEQFQVHLIPEVCIIGESV